MNIKQLIQFSDKDFEMIIEGVDELRNKGLSGELFGGLMEAMLIKPPREDAPFEEKERYQKHLQEKEAKKIKDEAERKSRIREIDILKAKLVLIKDMKDRADFARNGKKLESSS